MANLVQWRRPGMLSLQRDIEDVFEDFGVPRSIRRDMERLFDEVDSPRSLWREMDRLMEQFEAPPSLGSRVARLFENVIGPSRKVFGGQLGMRGDEMFVPQLDLVEQEKEYVMKADVPGIREQDIDIHIDDNNRLTISGERRKEETRKVRGYEYQERSYGSFSRTIDLPRSIDASKIQAEFHNGVLELHVPKIEGVQTHKIPLSRGEEPRVTGGNGHGVQVQQGQGQGQPQVHP